MIRAILFDFSRVLLFPKDVSYAEELNKLHRKLVGTNDYKFSDYFYFNQELIDYLRQMKDKYDLYMFTSGTIQETPEAAGKIAGIFKQIFSAEKMAVRKREASSYTFLAEKIGVPPAEILFVDDLSVNIEAAKQAGLATYLYDNCEGFKKYLEEITA